MDIEAEFEDEDDWDLDYPSLKEEIEDNNRFPMTKEQVWEAFTNLNLKGQNWVIDKIKEY